MAVGMVTDPLARCKSAPLRGLLGAAASAVLTPPQIHVFM
jgi:hypothetical protein